MASPIVAPLEHAHLRIVNVFPSPVARTNVTDAKVHPSASRRRSPAIPGVLPAPSRGPLQSAPRQGSLARCRPCPAGAATSSSSDSPSLPPIGGIFGPQRHCTARASGRRQGVTELSHLVGGGNGANRVIDGVSKDAIRAVPGVPILNTTDQHLALRCSTDEPGKRP